MVGLPFVSKIGFSFLLAVSQMPFLLFPVSIAKNLSGSRTRAYAKLPKIRAKKDYQLYTVRDHPLVNYINDAIRLGVVFLLHMSRQPVQNDL